MISNMLYQGTGKGKRRDQVLHRNRASLRPLFLFSRWEDPSLVDNADHRDPPGVKAG
jgi:hypothetical protein